jgi:hypothetical protein
MRMPEQTHAQPPPRGYPAPPRERGASLSVIFSEIEAAI